MSKIGRMPINTLGVAIEVIGKKLRYKGVKAFGEHEVPEFLNLRHENDKLYVAPTDLPQSLDGNKKALWGLHRALIANKIIGSMVEFERIVEMIGLGYKAAKKAPGLVFSLGYSHEIPFELPKAVSVDIDKTGQKLTFKSSDKELVGLICSRVCRLRPIEPYKGTGVKLSTDVVRRKAGKTKA